MIMRGMPGGQNVLKRLSVAGRHAKSTGICFRLQPHASLEVHPHPRRDMFRRKP